MTVDVVTEIEIDCAIATVASYAADPSNAPEWYENIDSVTWKTKPPLQLGSIVAFEARCLGRRLEYTYEIAEYRAGERLVMRTRQGPFPMETTYTWSPLGFSRLVAPLMAPAMRRANRKDLSRLKALLEPRRDD